MVLTLSDAQKAIEVGLSKATEIGVAVSIAVVDQRGDLMAVARMDRTRHLTPDIARGKAMASAIFAAPSGDLADAGDSQIHQMINRMSLDRMVFHQGAVPIKSGDDVLGAIGVSGASSQQDEEIALIAIQSLTGEQ